MAVDPSTPKNALSTPERPFTIWLAVNVQESQLQGSLATVDTSNVVLPYAPTVPAPQSPAHTLYFFVFEQNGRIADPSQIGAKYSDPLCADYVLGRYEINIHMNMYAAKETQKVPIRCIA